MPGRTSTVATPPPGHSAGPIRLGYQPTLNSFDEAVDAGGPTRPHWHTFFRSIAEIGTQEFNRRWRDAQQLIRENGVTYNVYGDPRGMTRPWQLDPVPLLISPTDAELLERGLTQRGVLLEKILADLYGEQRLLKQGLLPPELVFGNPGFWRPCHNVKVPNGRYLHLYAANVGRDGFGNWRVIGDRTQAPSGAGYALENRIVLNRTMPEAFRDCRVQRLALFFRTFRDTLRDIAPRKKDNPRIVLLTPGPFNETYFEHAYLARYLGITLVEGGDLTVRDNRVYLKLLGGLQHVDVIFRRLDDDFCDPLELRPDSFLGVPGLMNAVRAGNVTVANALGTGVVEAPALNAYLPQLCRHYFGEDLIVPSVPTWWCGDPASLATVIARKQDMVLKPAYLAGRMQPILLGELSHAEQEEWLGKVQANPDRYVAQERISLSTAPVLIDGKTTSRRLVLRAYLCADGDGFHVMPGGLTRISGDDTSGAIVTMQCGGGSKDTWVLSAGAVSNFSMLPPSHRPVEVTRAGGDLPSRSADHLFWLGRYSERAEGTARLLRGIFIRFAERGGHSEVFEMPSLLRTLTLHVDVYPGFIGEGGERRINDPMPEVMANVYDLKRYGSLKSVLESLRRTAGVVRDRISMDMWRVLSAADIPAHEPHDPPTAADVLEQLNRIIVTLSAFGGMTAESMTRTEGWRFLNMGRKLERALHITQLLRGTVTQPGVGESQVLDAILEIADSSMTYRRRYMNTLRIEPVLDLLISDETNPRSLAAQFASLVDDVKALPRQTGRGGLGPEQRMILQCQSAVVLAEVDQLAQIEKFVRPILRKLLDETALAIPLLSDTISHQYLSHLQTSRHLASF